MQPTSARAIGGDTEAQVALSNIQYHIWLEPLHLSAGTASEPTLESGIVPGLQATRRSSSRPSERPPSRYCPPAPEHADSPRADPHPCEHRDKMRELTRTQANSEGLMHAGCGLKTADPAVAKPLMPRAHRIVSSMERRKPSHKHHASNEHVL